MLEQVNHLCKSVRFHLKNISQIRKYITEDICHSAVRCHILSRLDYCNCLLTSVPQVYLKRLQSLQNWAARIIFKLDRRHDSSPLLKSLHWLPVKERILFKILLFVFKAFHDQTPTYIKDCFTFHNPSRPNLRSSRDPFLLTIPRTRSKSGDRTFTVTASTRWNNIPSFIKAAKSTDQFKKRLKTHLFPV